MFLQSSETKIKRNKVIYQRERKRETVVVMARNKEGTVIYTLKW